MMLKTIIDIAKRHSRLLRLAASAFLLLLLFRQVSMEEIASRFDTLMEYWPLLAIAVFLPGVGIALSAYRWKILLSALGGNVSTTFLVKGILVGGFFNQLLPSTVGGDVARAWWIGSAFGSSVLNLTVVVVDRVVGLVGICAVALIAASMRPDIAASVPVVWAVVLIVGLIFVLLFVPAHRKVRRWGHRLFRLPMLRALYEKATIAHQGLQGLRAAKGHLLGALGLSILLQIEMVILFAVLAMAMGMTISTGELAVVVPLVTLVTLLPISVNGIGLREASLALLGAHFGLTPADAISLAWTVLFLQMLYALIGGCVYLKGKPKILEAPHAS
ncbi:MAG: lysylphosphatidylglycerol synthase transmembrane domain-containing protein [Nitrospira sp.]